MLFAFIKNLFNRLVNKIILALFIHLILLIPLNIPKLTLFQIRKKLKM